MPSQKSLDKAVATRTMEKHSRNGERSMNKRKASRRQTGEEMMNTQTSTRCSNSTNSITSIRHGKKNKSPGEDRIHYEMLHHLPKCSKKVLLNLCNDVWTEGTLPPAWKHSIILPFLKPKKDASNPGSYRPIALTSTLCKVMEGMITNRLQWHMEKCNLFNPFQAGFRKRRCTVDHIMRLQNDVQAALNHGSYAAGIFLDFSKAFDMMWKGGVMEKLSRMKIGGRIFNWIDDFLSERTFQVWVGDQLSDVLRLDNGTPQGSRLSPLLFLIQINDFPEPENNTKQAISADDSSIWRTGTNLKIIMRTLQIDLNKIEKWCDEWGFTLSTEKTIGVTFSHHHQQPEIPALRLCGKEIKIEEQVKFLGVIFDRKLTWKAHMNHIVDRCNKVINMMRSLTGQRWGADKRSLLMIYRALIWSKIDYACQAYDTASDTAKKELDKLQAAALRIACGAMKSMAIAALQVECGEMPLEQRRQNLSLKYAAKISSAENHPTTEILTETWQQQYMRENQKSYLKSTRPYLEQITADRVKTRLSEVPPMAPDTSKGGYINTRSIQEEGDKWSGDEGNDRRELVGDERRCTPNLHGWIGRWKRQSWSGLLRPTKATRGSLPTYGSSRNPHGRTDCHQTSTPVPAKRKKQNQRSFIVIHWVPYSPWKVGNPEQDPNLLREIINLNHSLNAAGQNTRFHWIPSHVGHEWEREGR